MNQTLQLKLIQARKDALKPPSTRTVLECAMSERILSIGSSNKPGPWKPIVRAAVGPMLAVTQKGVRKITIKSSAQLLKSDFLLNTLLYFLSDAATSVILAQPSEKAAADFSQTRVSNLIKDCKVLREAISQQDNQLYLKQFRTGGRVNIISAAAPSDLASRSVQVLLLDEIDRYKNIHGEGDPMTLLEARLTTFFNSLDIAVSTPTDDGSSRIEERYLQSSQHEFHGRCPHCDNLEHLIWDQVQIPDDDPKKAYYQCSVCETPWSEADRRAAVDKGEYIAKVPSETTHLGFHANCIASPFQSLSYFASQYVASKDKPDKLRAFTNTQLSETYKPKVNKPAWERLYSRRELYKIGVIPKVENNPILFLTLGVDIQSVQNRIECQVIGWCKDKQSYTIEYIKIDGNLSTDEPWAKLRSVIDRQYKIEGSEGTLPISMAFVDSGAATQSVYSFVVKLSPTKVKAIKGMDYMTSGITKMSGPLEVNYNGVKQAFNGHHLFLVSSPIGKDQLYSNLSLEQPVDGNPYPPNYAHFPEFDSDFFQQLTNEALVQLTDKNGNTTYVWKKLGPNEVMDTWVYAYGAACVYGLHRFTDMEWAALEERVKAIPEVVKDQQTQLSENRQKQIQRLQKNSLWKHQSLRR